MPNAKAVRVWTVVWVGLITVSASAQVIERISVGSSGAGGSGTSSLGCRAAPISEDGRYVVFVSDAPDLVAGDSNGVPDVFLRDRVLQTTTRLSVDVDGNDANGASEFPCLTPDGRYVVFQSDASDLVDGDVNGVTDVFIHDLALQTTARVSLDLAGLEANDASRLPSISADGRFVAFTSNASDLVADDGNGTGDTFVRDLVLGINERVSVDIEGGDPDLHSWRPHISADGRYVMFHSGSSDHVPGDVGVVDIFVRDRHLDQTIRATVNSSGETADGNSYGGHLSADGHHVAFWSRATDLVAGDTNGLEDVFVHDLDTGSTDRISLRADGSQITDIASWGGSASRHGRFVVFFADSDQLLDEDVNGATDVYAFDRRSGRVMLLTVRSDGAQSNAWSHNPKVSADGRFVVFESDATNLADNDTNNVGDVFIGRGPASVFEDGFESGNENAWSFLFP